MTLYVDDKSCPTREVTALPIGYSIDRLTNPQSACVGMQIELTIPSTAASNAIFGAARDLYSAERFNSARHKARVVCDGVTLFEGTIYLISSSMNSRFAGDYKVRIVTGGKEWAKEASRRQLRSCGIPFKMALTPENIKSTWTEDKSVRFLPVLRNRYTALYSGSSMAPKEYIMTTDDYHPFFSIASLFEKIFEGYKVEGNFWNSTQFRELMMSGQYASPDTAKQRALLDFCASRKSPVTAVADSYGKVYATASFDGESSLGNIVDTANPTAVNSDGELMQSTFNTGNVFGIDDEGYCRFESSIAANVGFILHLDYTTAYRIADRRTLAGFNHIVAGEQLDTAFSITNGFKDQRGSLAAGVSYNLCIFDFPTDALYMLRITDAESGEELATQVISERFTSVTMPESCTPVCTLEAMTGEKLSAEFDWALYFGYVAEYGETDVVVDVRIPPREFSAGEKMRFNSIRFLGAEPGMTITLSNRCTLRPYFSTVPGYGSEVGIRDIANSKIWLIEVVEAICQMFNLVIFTDEERKRVVIEPKEEFYSDTVWDWSDKVDRDSPIRVADMGVDAPNWLEYEYLEADYASKKFNEENATQIGEWRVENPTYGALDTTKVYQNNLFTTGINKRSDYALAPSASIMQVGDSAAEGGMDSPFTTHIVRYVGLQPLPEGEIWGYPLSEASYPLAAFFFEGDENSAPFSLCFENRDGIEGLHRYYDADAERIATSQRLSLTLWLKPTEVEKLFDSRGYGASIRDTFRLDILGESSLYRLESFESYNPETQSAKCTFIRLKKD